MLGDCGITGGKGSASAGIGLAVQLDEFLIGQFVQLRPEGIGDPMIRIGDGEFADQSIVQGRTGLRQAGRGLGIDALSGGDFYQDAVVAAAVSRHYLLAGFVEAIGEVEAVGRLDEGLAVVIIDVFGHDADRHAEMVLVTPGHLEFGPFEKVRVPHGRRNHLCICVGGYALAGMRVGPRIMDSEDILLHRHGDGIADAFRQTGKAPALFAGDRDFGTVLSQNLLNVAGGHSRMDGVDPQIFRGGLWRPKAKIRGVEGLCLWLLRLG